MANEKMPEKKAYAKATSEFYEIRAHQEEEGERKTREKMNSALNNLSRKWS